ncbi:unnamed protein product [Leptosia nina]|uniref:Uncharacterized protein n=1 Tax=Leptosia nina TaxID=320188 RepID=A0AAV1JJD9_9NEOP
MIATERPAATTGFVKAAQLPPLHFTSLDNKMTMKFMGAADISSPFGGGKETCICAYHWAITRLSHSDALTGDTR